MKHIFFLHSNTCVITAYQTIKELIKNNEKVIVILNRGTKFPFYNGDVTIFDIQFITDNFRKRSTNFFNKIYNYKFQYLPHFDVIAKEIIGEEQFILYAPSYNQFTLRSFFNSKYLIGYYYIEEGTLSYLSLKSLKRKFYKKMYLKGRFISKVIGLKEYYDYVITNKFRGAICLSTYAFPWLSNNKIINKFDEYLVNLNEKSLDVDALIVTGYLFETLDEIYNGLNIIFDKILSDSNKRKVAIKFHPTAFSYHREKCELVKQYLNNKYSNLEIIFLESSYSVEGSLYRNKTDLYSIFGISSLCLYSLVFGSNSFVVYRKHSMYLDEITSVDDFLKKANS
jgi:hypothetical protein